MKISTIAPTIDNTNPALFNCAVSFALVNSDPMNPPTNDPPMPSNRARIKETRERARDETDNDPADDIEHANALSVITG
jgi:hypothetical protein